MKTLCVTTEFNPFHLGHKKMLSEAKKQSDADAIICLMSGNFVQRGEPAIFDKITRAKCAILSGANLVLEIPTIYACSNAETFSTYASKLANQIGSDYLLFGCETQDVNLLQQIADTLANESSEFKKILHEELSIGNSFAYAREKALSALVGHDVTHIIKSPNNILAIEYLKAIKKNALNIEPILLHRVEDEPLYSATSIRKMLKEDINNYQKLPEETIPSIEAFFESNHNILSINHFAQTFMILLRQLDENANIPYTEPGMILLLQKNSHLLCTGNVDDFLDACCSKRYTKARIRRVLLCILLGITDADIPTCENIKPNYIRVLASDKIGFKALTDIRQKTNTILSERMLDLQNVAKENNDLAAYNELKITARATDIYVSAQKNPEHASIGTEYTSGSFFSK